ncbi:MAG: hypothetical protein ACI9BD_001354 [Candidatus Marinamargulisbacteria bacterium]|jgi:hypothetical protein
MRPCECEQCGSGIPIIHKIDDFGDLFQVACSNFECENHGNRRKSEREAVQDWNFRNIQQTV